MRTIYLTTACICLGWTVKAQDSLRSVQLDEVVVTGTKTEVPVEKSGKSIFRISREDIERSAGKTVSDLLNEVPGVQMDGNFGPLGTNIDYRIRGAASRQTLILIDGVPFNDPSGISQTFDLRYLNLDQIESIEVLKGGLSTLYGTGAAAGVINIKLKEAENETLKGSINTQYGSFSSLRTGLNLSGRSSELSYLISGGYKRSDGFSAAQDESGIANFDDDGFEGFNVLAKVGYDFSDRFNLGFTASLDDIEYDFDGGAFTDNDAFADQQQLRLGLSPQYSWGSGKLSGDIYYSTLDRLFNSPDFFDPNARFISEFHSESVQADLIVDQNLSDQIKLLGGVNFQQFGYSQPDVEETSFELMDPYLTFILEDRNFNFQLGGRLNNHSEYGTKGVWNSTTSYQIHTTADLLIKPRMSFSTSFITPSLFQLFTPGFGNPDLEPEESQSSEFGIDLYRKEKLEFGLTYFYRLDENAIGFQSFLDEDGNFTGGEYFNINGYSEVEGVELNASYSFTPEVTLSGHYTYLNNLSEDQVLFRVPQDKFGFSLATTPLENVLIELTHLYVGETLEATFQENIVLASYNLFDCFASYTFNWLTLSFAVNNILNEEYQPQLGFNAIGRNYTMGVTVSF